MIVGVMEDVMLLQMVVDINLMIEDCSMMIEDCSMMIDVILMIVDYIMMIGDSLGMTEIVEVVVVGLPGMIATGITAITTTSRKETWIEEWKFGHHLLGHHPPLKRDVLLLMVILGVHWNPNN